MATVWSEAFDAAYGVTPDWNPLADLLTTRTGKTVSPDWLAASIDEAFAHVMLYAPCKAALWVTPVDVPDAVQAVIVGVLARQVSNPEGIRTVQFGEFSQTWAGNPEGVVSETERRIVGRAAGCPEGGLSTIDTQPTPLLLFEGTSATVEDTRIQPSDTR